MTRGPTGPVIIHRRGPNNASSPRRLMRTAPQSAPRPKRRVDAAEAHGAGEEWVDLGGVASLETIERQNNNHPRPIAPSHSSSSLLAVSLAPSVASLVNQASVRDDASEFSELSFGFGVSLEALASAPTADAPAHHLHPGRAACTGWCEFLTGQQCDACRGSRKTRAGAPRMPRNPTAAPGA